jgi:GntR family transcriptional regulator
MDKTVFQPLYRQTEILLTQALMAGEWPPGALIPSEPELAARFGVSQGTIRKAIEALRAEKLFVRRQGRGTYVATHREEAVQYRFLKLRPDKRPPYGLRSLYLSCIRLKAPPDVALALELPAQASIIQIRRVLLERAPGNIQNVDPSKDQAKDHPEDKPLVFEEINLPGARFKGLNAERLSAYQGPLYGLFETEFGVRMVGGEERLKAVIGPEKVCIALEQAIGTPMLFVDRLTVSYDSKPVEVRRAYYLSDGYHYASRL